MLDIESIIFDAVAKSLRTEFTGIFVSGDNVAAPTSFPAAAIVEEDNTDYERSMDAPDAENHVVLMYQVDAYSNKTKGRKAETKAIMSNIDATMKGFGFVRIASSPMNNMDNSIYRMVARYRAVVGKYGDEYLSFHK